MARALVHDKIVVEVAARRGVTINVDGSGLRECMESSSCKEIVSEAARKLSKWDENMANAENVVYSSFLVSAAREAIDVDRIVRMPMISHVMKKDESVQVSLPCPECVLLEKSLSDGVVDENFSLSDSGMKGDFNVK